MLENFDVGKYNTQESIGRRIRKKWEGKLKDIEVKSQYFEIRITARRNVVGIKWETGTYNRVDRERVVNLKNTICRPL